MEIIKNWKYILWKMGSSKTHHYVFNPKFKKLKTWCDCHHYLFLFVFLLLLSISKYQKASIFLQSLWRIFNFRPDQQNPRFFSYSISQIFWENVMLMLKFWSLLCFGMLELLMISSLVNSDFVVIRSCWEMLWYCSSVDLFWILESWCC